MQRGIDYIGVGVGAATFNSEGKLFLTLRGKKAILSMAREVS